MFGSDIGCHLRIGDQGSDRCGIDDRSATNRQHVPDLIFQAKEHALKVDSDDLAKFLMDISVKSLLGCS